MVVAAWELLINISRYIFGLWLCVSLFGCASINPQSSKTYTVTDQTFGHYHENLEPDLIVITMTPEHQAQLTELKPVPLGVELPPRYAEFLDNLNAKYGLTRVANWPLPAIDVFCVVFEVQDQNNRDFVVAALELEPGVETAQIVQTFDSQSQNYNDPYLSMQHGVHSIQAINSHQWSRGKGVRVAVIDTGMDYTHSDLASSSEASRNFVDNDETTFLSDTHGTAVGGVIAADTDNATGMVGIAPDAMLLALKACWQISRQDENKARCNSLTLAKALNFSIEQKVDIINLSLTGPPDPLLERLVLKALTKDIIVVGAKPEHNKAAFPVSIRGTISVSMPNSDSDSDSNTISAPGHNVLSTRPNEQYDFFNGSSFSTAHISGLAALLRTLSPALTSSDLLQLIKVTADPKTGSINACRAVESIQQQNDMKTVSKSCN